jgi:hypothetical protein
MLIYYNNLVYSLLHRFEKNRITDLSKNTLEEFADQFGYYSEKVLLTNLNTELALFEQALEGDTNRDFSAINDTAQDSEGDTPKANAVDALLDHLDLLLLGGNMSQEYRAAMKHYLLDSSATNRSSPAAEAIYLVRDAIMMIATSSSYMVQK